MCTFQESQPLLLTLLFLVLSLGLYGHDCSLPLSQRGYSPLQVYQVFKEALSTSTFCNDKNTCTLQLGSHYLHVAVEHSK